MLKLKSETKSNGMLSIYKLMSDTFESGEAAHKSNEDMGVISLPGLPDDDDEPISPLSSSLTIVTPGHTTCAMRDMHRSSGIDMINFLTEAALDAPSPGTQRKRHRTDNPMLQAKAMRPSSRAPGHGGLCVQQFESKFLQHDADLDLRLEITPLGARNALMPGRAPEK